MTQARTARFLAATSLAVSAALLPARGIAVARVEIHPFQSATVTDREFLTGQKGKPVTITGELRLPKPGNDRLPAVILVHPSGGIGGSVDDWAQFLGSLGVATFVLDSFTPRGIVDTIADQSQLSRIGTVVDVYRALDLLSKHRRIDPRRIAVMGFSRGAVATLYAAMTRFQRMHGPADARFVAYVPFSPDCATTYIEDVDVVDAPIRIFHGGADDYSPIAPCRAYVDRLRKAGKDVRLTEYPGAQHMFDAAALQTPVKLPQAQTPRRCRMEETPGGIVVNAETRKPFGYDDPCIERGATIAYDPRAATDAQRSVREFLSSVFAQR